MSESDHSYTSHFNDEFSIYGNSSRNEASNVDSEIGDSFDELIIACIQSYPHLYNKGDKNYKNNNLKEKSWEEIATTCRISDLPFKELAFDEVQQRWKRLKEKFGRQRRMNDYATRSGSAAQKVQQWPLFKSMRFMEKHMQRRRVFSNVSLPFTAEPENVVLDQFNLTSGRNESGSFNVRSRSISESNQASTQSIQRVKKTRCTCESCNLEFNDSQKAFCEAQSVRSASELPWNNSQTSTVTTTYHKAFIGDQTSIFSKLRCTSANPKDSCQNIPPKTPLTLHNSPGHHIVISSKIASDVSDRSLKHCSPTSLQVKNSSNSTDRQSATMQMSTPSSSLSLDMPKKCFNGDTLQKKRKKSNQDSFEISFVNAANAFKEYIHAANRSIEGKENSTEDSYLAKFIVARLFKMPEQQRDEKRRKLIELLLSD